MSKMSVSLSPEQYLRYPVEVSPVARSERTESQQAGRANENIVHRCRKSDYSVRYENPWVDALRSARFETIRPAADLEVLKCCEDVIIKYCVPIVDVMNSVVLKNNVPTLRLSRSQESTVGYPIALMYSGIQDSYPLSETARVQIDQWHKRTVLRDNGRERLESQPPDWTKVNKCFAVVVFLPPGELVLDDICVEHRNVHIRDANLRHAFHTLMITIENTRAVVGILTDEKTSLIVDYLSCCYDEDLPMLTSVSTSVTGLRILISSFIYAEADAWDLVRIHPFAAPRLLQGTALDKTSLKDLLDDSQVRKKRWFSDFDLYTMQRVPEFWYKFADWRRHVRDEGLKHLIGAGMTITFEPDAFARRFGLLRSPYPYRTLPQETTDSILTHRERRPRNATLDAAIRSSEDVTLVVHEPIRIGPEHFSQVFSAYVTGCNELVCVKLFDERFFCIPEVDDDECVIGPCEERLGSLHYSEDLARHEECVYHRLSALQGRLLPHCYGFHLFTLPDGWQCYGLVMEKIEGPPIKEIFKTNSQAVQVSLISQMRHGVRALRAAGISQRDWHLNQILCSLRSHDRPEIVFIDFGFSEMYVGDENGTPTTHDLVDVWGLLCLRLGVEDEILDQYWIPPVEYEY
ncbi:hypothetical protein NM688_g6075 [Phlebia brevispora]|uniref:Uncharacterized protein n=1 Tax=Phlebia brevispora TaxID=194682 RepID=A0ACC1SKD5_9APHY|nr:hypothetical protein NM688_g6075 [Phlebia brevispora]